MAVITISREFGSSGTEIAKKVAKALNYRFVDKEIIGEVLKEYGLIEFHEVYDAAPTIWPQFDAQDKKHVQMLNRTILACAKMDDVMLLGRGGFVMLHEYLNVVNIRIRAPLQQRVKNIMEITNIDDPVEAEDYVKEQEKIHHRFLQNYYDIRWDDLSLFQMVIDTCCIPVDMAAEWIVQAAHMLEEKEFDPQETTQAIEVDKVLAKTVAEKVG